MFLASCLGRELETPLVEYFSVRDGVRILNSFDLCWILGVKSGFPALHGVDEMHGDERGRKQKLSVWQLHDVPDYAPIEAKMPVVENAVTQVAPGPFVASARIVSNGVVSAVHTSVTAQSVGSIILKPGFTGFLLPLRWAGEFILNGALATPNTIHAPVDEVSMHTRGGQREQIGCVLPRARFVETVAALCGADPDTFVLHEGALELAPKASRRLRNQLLAIVDRGVHADLKSDSSCAPFDLTNEIFELMVEAYLHARPEPMPKSGCIRNAERIVRAAEERFAQAGAQPVSLADLCAATSVSKSLLYLAFRNYCGEPPIAYFHKRRLTKARSRLLDAEPRRGEVKRTALEVGLTELGRFSRDYRHLFGESPSATLNRSAL